VTYSHLGISSLRTHSTSPTGVKQRGNPGLICHLIVNITPLKWGYVQRGHHAIGEFEMKLSKLGKKQAGASMIEYPVVVTLVVLAAVLTLTDVGTNLSAKFTSIANTVK